MTTLLISPVYPVPCLGLEIIGSEIWSLYPVEIPLYKALLKKFEVQIILDGSWPRGPNKYEFDRHVWEVLKRRVINGLNLFLDLSH